MQLIIYLEEEIYVVLENKTKGKKNSVIFISFPAVMKILFLRTLQLNQFEGFFFLDLSLKETAAHTATTVQMIALKIKKIDGHSVYDLSRNYE